nr:hypothetical protein [Tanacetum cinerariifolium]
MGGDEIEVSDNESSNLEEYWSYKEETAEIFKIKIDDGYCNGGKLHYQDLECNDCWKRWRSHEITYHDHDEIESENETHDERKELGKAHELPVCNIIKFKMIKYSFGQDDEYVAVKENRYDDLARTSYDACRTYQEIFRLMDEGWMVTRAE